MIPNNHSTLLVHKKHVVARAYDGIDMELVTCIADLMAGLILRRSFAPTMEINGATFSFASLEEVGLLKVIFFLRKKLGWVRKRT